MSTQPQTAIAEAPRTVVSSNWRPSLHAGNWIDVAFVPGVVITLSVYLSLSTSVFFTRANLSNVLAQSVTLALVSFGVTFVILAREIDLSVGAGVALVSVLAAKTMLVTGSVALGLLVGVATGVGIGIVNGLIVTLIEVPSFIATLGMLVMLRGASMAITDGGVVFGLPHRFNNLAESTYATQPLIVWIMAATFVALYLVQRQTSFGVRVFAVGGNPAAAHLAGIRTRLVRFSCFVISGCTIGLAGLALTARVESGQPNGGQLLELYAIAAVVIGGTSLFGGRGSVARSLFGVLLIVIMQNGLDLTQVNYDLQQTIIGAVFIAAASVDFVRRRMLRRAAALSVSRSVAAASEAAAPASMVDGAAGEA